MKNKKKIIIIVIAGICLSVAAAVAAIGIVRNWQNRNYQKEYEIYAAFLNADTADEFDQLVRKYIATDDWCKTEVIEYNGYKHRGYGKSGRLQKTKVYQQQIYSLGVMYDEETGRVVSRGIVLDYVSEEKAMAFKEHYIAEFGESYEEADTDNRLYDLNWENFKLEAIYRHSENASKPMMVFMYYDEEMNEERK